MTTQSLKFNINNSNNLKISVTVNQKTVTEEILLDLDIDNTVELKCLDSYGTDFFYIESVEFGRLDITDLLHRENICQTFDSKGTKIADFVKEVGKNDRVVVDIKQNFYSLLVKNINIVKVL